MSQDTGWSDWFGIGSAAATVGNNNENNNENSENNIENHDDDTMDNEHRPLVARAATTTNSATDQNPDYYATISVPLAAAERPSFNRNQNATTIKNKKKPHVRNKLWTVELDVDEPEMVAKAAYSSIGSNTGIVESFEPLNDQQQKQKQDDKPFPLLTAAAQRELEQQQQPPPLVVQPLDAPPLLNKWQGALLLTADCLGTGLLALPGDVQVLGLVYGLGFLLLNAPINYCAGSLLSHAATIVERRQEAANRIFAAAQQQKATQGPLLSPPHYQEVNDTTKSITSIVTIIETQDQDERPHSHHHHHHHRHLHHDTATFDFIGMTQALWKSKTATRLVMMLYYGNIFLVLGNYILVMSHSVMAALNVTCVPVAGLLASVTMYGVSQSRTMARLGRAASMLSLSALLIVILQCLYFARHSSVDNESLSLSPQQQQDDTNLMQPNDNNTNWTATTTSSNVVSSSSRFWIHWTTVHMVLHKLSALGSIGFAMGSQKLFLNIRHELQDRSQAPATLAISLSLFTAIYALIILLSGTHPPPFLFDAIPDHTISKQCAGVLLWGHVVVSYAINSQAICSSMDRLFVHRLLRQSGPAVRWMLLTAILSVLAYTVANAIPFFQDLVGFIGAVTSVPLTLLLPALFWRKVWQLPLWTLSRKWWVCGDDGWGSFLLVVFSVVFMLTATIGVLDTISQDWKNHAGAPFSCSG